MHLSRLTRLMVRRLLVFQFQPYHRTQARSHQDTSQFYQEMGSSVRIMRSRSKSMMGLHFMLIFLTKEWMRKRFIKKSYVREFLLLEQ